MNLEIEFLQPEEKKIVITQEDLNPVVEAEPSTFWWDVLLVVLTPGLFLYRQILTFVLWIDVRYIHDRKISHFAKCPGCGVREYHEYQMSEDYERVIHSCKNCKAEWGEKPVVPYSRWKISRQQEIKQPEETLGGII